MTHQQAMLAELLDSRQAELRLALVAESLPDLVADAVRAAMDEHTEAMAGSFDRSHERFLEDVDQIRADSAETVEALSESFQKLSGAIAVHDEEAEHREAARLSVLKGSVTRQFTPLAEAVAALAAKVDDLSEQIDAPGGSRSSTWVKAAPAGAAPSRAKGTAAARSASQVAKPAVGQRVSTTRMKGAGAVDQPPAATPKRMLTAKDASPSTTPDADTDANGAAASPLARRAATSRTATPRSSTPARPTTGRQATGRAATAGAATASSPPARPAAARVATGRVATRRAAATSPATGSPATGSPATGIPATGIPATGSPATAGAASDRPVAARVAAARAARAARASAEAGSGEEPVTAPITRVLTGRNAPASSLPDEPVVVYELETEDDDDAGWAPPAWVSAATQRPVVERSGTSRPSARSSTANTAGKPRSTRTPN
ncbi:MAG TPA: hypothetical protein VM942_07915 [Acidimicrobiales bacterium]|nr:hypothetical protein [Acidimicrobiales bacterium]